MPRQVALSLTHNGCVDLFKVYGLDEPLSCAGLAVLARRSKTLNQILSSFRDGLKQSLSELKEGSKHTELFNFSKRQSRLLEHKEMRGLHNGDSMSVLGRVMFQLGDREKRHEDVTTCNLLLADKAHGLEPGESFYRDTCDDFDRFTHDTKDLDVTSVSIFNLQLEYLMKKHPSDDLEFIVITENADELLSHLETIKKSIPQNITIEVKSYQWHKVINEHVKGGMRLLADFEFVLRNLAQLTANIERIMSSFGTRQEWQVISQQKTDMLEIIAELIELHPGETVELKALIKPIPSYSVEEFQQMKEVIGSMTDKLLEPLASKDCKQLSEDEMTPHGTFKGEMPLAMTASATMHSV